MGRQLSRFLLHNTAKMERAAPDSPDGCYCSPAFDWLAFDEGTHTFDGVNLDLVVYWP